MAQLTIYLDKKTLSQIEKSARQDKDSISHWVRKRLTASLETRGWPAGYFDFLKNNPCHEINVPDELPWELDRPREGL